LACSITRACAVVLAEAREEAVRAAPQKAGTGVVGDDRRIPRSIAFLRPSPQTRGLRVLEVDEVVRRGRILVCRSKSSWISIVQVAAVGSGDLIRIAKLQGPMASASEHLP
jgi:hypothetical protein